MATPVASDSIQTRLLDQIRKRLPEHMNLADELAELLSISRDSAYRRIRGETVLSLDEAKKLYDRYGVSIDEMFSPDSNMALFYHRPLTDIDKWLTSVCGNMEVMDNLQEKNKEMVYAAKDIPIFHYFRFPELSSFKMFFWLKSVAKDPKYSQKLYTVDIIPRETTALAARVWKHYSAIPTIEIWTDEAINDTLKQISYFRECGYFADPNDASMLCDQLLNLIGIIKEEAAEGKTTEGESFTLYENEILIADNTVLAKMGHKRAVYINYNTFNLLITLQDSFGAKTEAYLDNLMKNCILISSNAAKERNRFFSKMRDRIESLKKKMSE